MKSVANYILAIFLFALIPANAKASCENLRFLPLNSLLLSSNDTRQTMQIEVRKTSGTCHFFLGASRGSSPSFARELTFGASHLSYNVFTNVNTVRILKDAPDANGDEVSSGTFSGKGEEKKTVLIYVAQPAAKLSQAGLYSDQIILHLYDGLYGGSNSVPPVPVDSNPMPISYSVPLLRQISLVDIGQAFNPAATLKAIDFGELKQGKSAGFDLIVRTNSDFAVKMFSKNGGKLEHTELKKQQISYSLSIDGVIKNLNQTTPVQVLTGFGTTPESGSRHPVSIVVGPTDKALAGRYSDVITISIEGF
jgi:spore coat protein U-like protein